METLPTLAERVAAGAALLDAHIPGWAGLVNLATLRLESCHDCVMGQLYGYYGKGVDRLFAIAGADVFIDPARFGFVSPDIGDVTELGYRAGLFTYQIEYYYNDLREVWTAEILKRREVPA